MSTDLDNILKSSDGAALRFFYDTRPNAFQSERHGRPLYDKVLMVEVITPGSRESCPVFELEREFCEEAGLSNRTSVKYTEYKAQVDVFKSGAANHEMRGTPLKAWPSMDAALCASLEHAGVFTVEGLAALPDEKFRVVGPGARAWVDRAKAFLAAAAGNAPSEALAAELAQVRKDGEDKDEQIKQLAAQLAELAAKVNAQPQTPPPLPDLTITPAAKPEVQPADVIEPVKTPKAANKQGGNATPII